MPDGYDSLDWTEYLEYREAELAALLDGVVTRCFCTVCYRQEWVLATSPMPDRCRHGGMIRTPEEKPADD